MRDLPMFIIIIGRIRSQSCREWGHMRWHQMQKWRRPGSREDNNKQALEVWSKQEDSNSR